MSPAEVFLKTHSINDICREIEGELDEHGTDDWSFWYGNGELIACSAHNEDETHTYFVDTYGDRKVLVG